MAVLRNDFISIEVNTLGAELVSLKKKGESFEYIWNGDSRFWTGQSPVLFPIVGFTNNGTTNIKGKNYELKNHGFARRQEFNLISDTNGKLIFSLRSNPTTLELYPYHFELRLIYALLGNSVKISYEVENPSNEDIYFQLGTHPGFNCPATDGLDFSDYQLEFPDQETAKRYYIGSDGLILKDKTDLLLNNSTTLPLSHELFYQGALILKDIRSTSVTLKNTKNNRFVRVSWENFPYLGFWQPKDAPFVCIEPWHGITETESEPVEFKDKEQIICLAAGEIFRAEIKMEV